MPCENIGYLSPEKYYPSLFNRQYGSHHELKIHYSVILAFQIETFEKDSLNSNVPEQFVCLISTDVN